jgi:hypothetical protein
MTPRRPGNALGMSGVARWFARSLRGAQRRFGVRRRANLPLQTMEARIDTSTADLVAVEVAIAVRYHAPLHYAVLPQSAEHAFGELEEARTRFSASMSGTVRTCVPGIPFEELFERREQIADAVEHELSPVMNRVGYELLDAAVAGIRVTDPRAHELDLEGASTRAGRTGAERRDARTALSQWEGEGGRS